MQKTKKDQQNGPAGKAASIFESFGGQAFPHFDHAVAEQECKNRHETGLYENSQHIMANPVQDGWLKVVQFILTKHAVLKNQHVGH